MPKRGQFGFTYRCWPEPYCDGSFEVRPFPTTHLAWRGPDFQAYGMELRVGGCRILLSGDLGHASDLLEVLAVPCDLLVCEMSHIGPADLRAVLEQFPPTDLVITHADDETLAHSEAVLKMLTSCTKSVRFAVDGLVFPLEPRIPPPEVT